MANKINDELQLSLKAILDHCDLEDSAVRMRQIRTWKKFKYMWNGFQRVWWSEVAHDWKVVDSIAAEDSSGSSYYDKDINVFRSYGESIIAALSQTVPSITCLPDDADNPLDTSTARAADKIAELVFKHNNAPLLWVHALFILFTEGMVAAYNYTISDDEFGTYSEPKYENEEVEQQVATCPHCGYKDQNYQNDESLSDDERDEYDPDDDDSVSHNLLSTNEWICAQCLATAEPEITTEKVIVPRLTGVTSKPKSRQCIEIYGGLNVRVPNYARAQKDCPYLILNEEKHYAQVISEYPDLAGKFDKKSKIDAYTGGSETYERWGRLSTQYRGEYPVNTATIRTCWFRPYLYNVLKDDDQISDLKKKFPDGCKVTFINGDMFADACNESLDDHWTLTTNPLSDFIHYEPLGNGVVSVQEILTSLISLTLQTIEHGIPQTFADPSVLNFEQYSQTEVLPGGIFPAKPQGGKSIADGFYEVKTATLSGEVLPFAEKINELGQMVSGALPSLSGGAAPNSSKTAAQYAMSRSQALQRLQMPWKMLTFWWKQIFAKVIPAYIKDMVDDEKVTKKDSNGNYIQTFIRKAELQGKIGSIELEASEEIPLTWGQKRDALMKIVELQIPQFMAALSDPANAQLVAEAIGMDDFIIPGQEDRQKQYEEIQQLVASAPIPTGIIGPAGPMLQPSVEVEPLVDNHEVEIEICRRWLVSEEGRQVKIDNPEGYHNVLLHMQSHMQIMQQLTMNQPAPEPQGQPKMKAKGLDNGSGTDAGFNS